MGIEGDQTRLHTKRNKATHQITANLPEDSKPLPNLPPEIIVEILSRLPVKSLLQFRCVSKSLRSLISSSQFIKTHLKISINSSEFTNHRLLSSSIRPFFCLKSFSLYSVLYEPSMNAIDVDYPLKDPHRSVWIVGSCNGLICLSIEEDALFLWNPTTRKSKELMNSSVKLMDGCFVIYGFGYSESVDDYKVVRIYCVFGNAGSYETEVNIYSLNANSWRMIQDFPSGVPLDDSGKFANGALHWAASRRVGSKYSWEIVSFDLAKETFGLMVQPNYEEGDFDFTLGVLGGCLCVLRNYYGNRADIWVMKKYGMSDSWTKLYTIPYLTDPGKYEYSIPLCVSKNGEILLEFGSNLIMYNSKDNTFKYPEICNFNACLEVVAYVESLVSPDAENEVVSQHQQ